MYILSAERLYQLLKNSVLSKRDTITKVSPQINTYSSRHECTVYRYIQKFASNHLASPTKPPWYCQKFVSRPGIDIYISPRSSIRPFSGPAPDPCSPCGTSITCSNERVAKSPSAGNNYLKHVFPTFSRLGKCRCVYIYRCCMLPPLCSCRSWMHVRICMGCWI